MGNVSLKDFVRETLTSISLGVAEAQDQARRKGDIAIRLWSVGNERTTQGEQLVRFTVYIEVSSASAVEGRGNLAGPMISVVTGSLEADGKRERSQQSHHSIEYSVPMSFDARWDRLQEN